MAIKVTQTHSLIIFILRTHVLVPFSKYFGRFVMPTLINLKPIKLREQQVHPTFHPTITPLPNLALLGLDCNPNFTAPLTLETPYTRSENQKVNLMS